MLTGIQIFVAYEFKIMLALGCYKNFDCILIKVVEQCRDDYVDNVP